MNFSDFDGSFDDVVVGRYKGYDYFTVEFSNEFNSPRVYTYIPFFKTICCLWN